VRIVKSTRNKVCVDGSLMKEYLLDEPLSEDFLEFLKHFGDLQILEHLRSPFFAFDKPHFLSIKGIIGDNLVEVRYKPEAHDLVMDYFHLLLAYFRSGKGGVVRMLQIEATITEKIEVRLHNDNDAASK
jgi:hypothetical protein